MVEPLYQPRVQDPEEQAFRLIVGLLEESDPIPLAEVARAMLRGEPVIPDDAGEVAREWAALGLLEEWRNALNYARLYILGGSDRAVDAPAPPGMRARGGALDAIVEGLSDDARAVIRRVETALRSEILPAALLIGALVAGTWLAMREAD